MRKLLAFLGVTLLVLSLAACGGGPTPGGDDGQGGDPKPQPPTTPIVPSQTVKEIVETDESLSYFAQALAKRDLLKVLAEEGPFTLFAPDNATIENVAEQDYKLNVAEYLDQVLLEDILKYHIVRGKILASDFKNGDELTTLQGYPVTLEVTGEGAFKVEDVEIETPDVLATNGVVHIIKGVLIPRALGASEYPLNATNADGTDISGKVLFNELAPNKTEVVLELTGVPADAALTAHIHSGPAPADLTTDTGTTVSYDLNPVDAAGKSRTVIEGDPAVLFNYDGYLTVHSATGAVVAYAGIGVNGVEPGDARAKVTR